MTLSSTQKGALAENLVANELMIASGGQLSPFQPIADDDGIDVLIFNKTNGVAVPIQVKSRTNTIAGKNVVHFEVRKNALNADRGGLILCVLLSESLLETRCAWLFPMEDFADIAMDKGHKYVVRPNPSESSTDKYSEFRCQSMADVAERVAKYTPGIF